MKTKLFWTLYHMFCQAARSSGLNQTELAGVINIAQSNLCNILKGKNLVISVERLLIALRDLGYNISVNIEDNDLSSHGTIKVLSNNQEISECDELDNLLI